MEDKQKLFILLKALEGDISTPYVPKTIEFWAQGIRAERKFATALELWLRGVAKAWKEIDDANNRR